MCGRLTNTSLALVEVPVGDTTLSRYRTELCYRSRADHLSDSLARALAQGNESLTNNSMDLYCFRKQLVMWGGFIGALDAGLTFLLNKIKADT